MQQITIGDRAVGPGEPTYVIAEVGSNHNGDLATAKQLIDVAAGTGADAVKFQVFRADDLYVDDRDAGADSAYEQLSKLEVPYDWIPELHDYCISREVSFLATPFDPRSAERIFEYVPVFKIGSASLTYYPLLDYVASTGKPVLLSTGMHGRSEIADSVARLEKKEAEGLLLLHCVSAYPTPLDRINVTSVRTLSTIFETIVGFSDHTMDPVTAPTAAVANGAAVVEKHFTLDRTMSGPDHQFALEPNEFEQMVDAIRRTESALGDGCLDVTEIESNSIYRAKRRIYAAKRLEKGAGLTEDAVRLLRPGYSDDDDAMPAGHYDEIMGATVARTLEPGEPVSLRDIET